MDIMQSLTTMNAAAIISLIAGVLNWLFLMFGFIYIRFILSGNSHAGESGMAFMIFAAMIVPTLFLIGFIAAFFAKDHRLMMLLINLGILPAVLLFLMIGAA
jgi:hypothetical protein